MTDPLTRLVELTVYAPVGAAALLQERLPELIETGRRHVDQRVTVARFIGQMVVTQGRREIERRLATESDEDSGVPTVPGDEPGDAILQPGPDPRPSGGEPGLRPDPGAVPAAGTLPIDGYESLAAAQVVARLGGLDVAGLEAVESFERAHRNRRTVLNRIAQLRARA